MEPTSIAVDDLAVADLAPPTSHVRIWPWIDPVVDGRGHDPRSHYVERFWLGVLGPTAAWLLRRLVAGLDEHPDGYVLDMEAAAQSLGLSYTRGASSPFGKAFSRCIKFGLAHQRSDGYAVRRRIPDLTRRHLVRLPADVQRDHQRWLTAARGHDLDALQRGRAIATAMLDSGDDTGVIEAQLVAVGLPAPTAAEVVELLREERRQREV